MVHVRGRLAALASRPGYARHVPKVGKIQSASCLTHLSQPFRLEQRMRCRSPKRHGSTLTDPPSLADVGGRSQIACLPPCSKGLVHADNLRPKAEVLRW